MSDLVKGRVASRRGPPLNLLALIGCLGIGIVIAENWTPIARAKHTGSHVAAAINYHNEAALAADKSCGVNVVCTPSLEAWNAIYSDDEKALAEARQADISEMNKRYPGFGDHFSNEFIAGLTLIVEDGNNPAKRPELMKGQMLVHRFGDWFVANEDAIRRAK